MSSEFSPAFIIGVPRSGTTILRILLDSHSQIAGAPETSWITGGYTDFSIRQFVQRMDEDKVGASRNLSGVNSDVLYESARQFLKTLLTAYLEDRQKKHLVLKTPDDIRYLDFLLQLFPKSKYIHIYRDGRDVACSTFEKKGKFFGEKMMSEYGEFTVMTGLKRWYDWESKIQDCLEGDNTISISYEQLVENPVETLQQLTEFLGVPFEEQMLDYSNKEHEYPLWEAGSHDVKHKGGIVKGNINRWIREIPYWEWEFIDQQYGSLLNLLGYKTCEDIKKDKPDYVFAELSILRNKLQEKEEEVRRLQSLVDEKTNKIEELKKEDPLQDSIISWLRTENVRLEKQRNIILHSTSFKLGKSIILPLKKTVEMFRSVRKKISSFNK